MYEAAYFPQDRLFDHIDHLADATGLFVTGRIFRIVNTDSDKTSWDFRVSVWSRPGPHDRFPPAPMMTLEPFEESRKLSGRWTLCLSLAELPEVKKEFRRCRFRTALDIDLGFCTRPILPNSQGIPDHLIDNKIGLEKNGLIPGQEYEVIRWEVPGLAVSLKGVKGVYYHGLFEGLDAAT